MKRSKLKIKPKFSKSSDWEIVEDIPMFQDGGGYQWSTQKQEPVKLAVPNYATTKTDGRTKPLTEKELQDFRKHTENLKLQQQQQELAARKARIEQSIQAQSQPFSAQNLATETQAIGDKLRFFPNAPSDSNFGMIDNYINPFKFLGDMASGLGSVPYNVQQGNYGQAALAVGIPLGVGALAGIGTNSTKQFINNLANPLAGTEDLMNNLGNKYLPNAYKLNPFAFKPNPEMMYRGIGKEGMEDALESGVFRAKQNVEPIIYDGFNMSKQFNVTYYTPKFETANQYGKGFIAEVPKDATSFRLRYKGKGNKTWSQIADEDIPINKGRILEKDWLRRYKEVPKPASNFKSEIDWAKWNKEIPENKALMQEYNAIEQTSKANGTWMKNSDGSPFQGTPEQFVQQNSQNFKKAFPDGFENVFRGVRDKTVVKELNPERSMFTADFDLASNYTRNKEILTPFDQFNTLDKSQFNPNVKEGMFNLAHKKSPKSIELDNFGREWTSIDLTNPKQSISNIELNIKHLEEQLKRQKEFLKSGKQNLDGSWSFPDTDIVYSNQLYKEGIKGQEKIINSYKDRLKNINNLVKNEKELEKMKSVLGNKTTTDDIAKYIEDSNLDYVKIKNVDDSGLGDVSIVNHKKGNYLKSLVGNNGMFDMTNPNIYKSLLPIGATLGGISQIEQKKSGGKIKTDPKGYWNPKNHGKPVRIPSNRITMKGVNQPLLGISDTGYMKMMYPNGEYQFQGNSVTEFPIMQQGGQVRQPIRGTREQYQAYQDSLSSYNATKQYENVFPIVSNEESDRITKLKTTPNHLGIMPVGWFKKPDFSFSPYYKKPVQPISYEQDSIPLLQVPNFPNSYSRVRNPQEAERGKKDYFDKKTGKLLGTYKNGEKVSDWEIID